MSYRLTYTENNIAGFVQGKPGEVGAMVIKSAKGPIVPILCEGEDDVVLHFGKPSATYPEVFEAIAFSKNSPCWVGSAIGEEAVYGGIDVKLDEVVAFGIGAGRVSPDLFDYTNVNTYGELTPVGLVDGNNAQFTGNVTNVPMDEGSLVIMIDGERIRVDDVAGVISGTDINAGGTNTVNYVSGAFDFTLAGVPGEFATVTTDVDLTGGIDLSDLDTAGYQEISNIGSLGSFVGTAVPGIATQTDYELDITIDGSTYQLADISIIITDNWNTIAAAIETSLQAASTGSETVTIVGSNIRVTSDTKGATSSVLIAAGTAGTGSGDLLNVIDGLAPDYTTSINAAVAGQDINYFINIEVDGTLTEDIDLGNSASTTRTDIINAINTAVGATVATENNTGGEFIDITGAIADSQNGMVDVDDPTTGSSALTKVFNTGGTALIDAATDPTGVIPKSGQVIRVGWVYNTDLSVDISHSIFTASPYEDDIAGEVEFLSGYQFKLTLYERVGTNHIYIDDYTYSLVREKDNLGRSLYYEDVFKDNPYVQIIVNDAFPGGVYSITPSKVNFTGGYRGDEPADSDYLTTWSQFELKTKYPTKIFMDVNGRSASKILDLVTNYQEWAQGMTKVPLGNDQADAVSWRDSLGIDSDKLVVYTNWAIIKDPYNDSSALVSLIGSVGKKWAMMQDVYDADSPAGIDENGHGGILQDWEVQEMEYTYSDNDLRNLDEAQINPIIKDEAGRIKVYGDKTMIIELTDTSYIGTRRLYNFMAETIITQVLKKQEFRINDAPHRLTAKMVTEDFLRPIKESGYLNDFYVQCDEKNNNDNVLNQRKFILDIFVKAATNSQFIQLRLTRLSQTQVIADFIVQ